MQAKQEERVLSVTQVAGILQESLKKTYECSISFYNNDVLIFTFFDHGDDFLTLRVSGHYFSVANRPTITDRHLLPISSALRRAVECMNVLGVKPVSTVVEEPG